MEIDRQDGTLRTGAQLISSELNITCAVLNGANVASDVAEEHFAEARSDDVKKQNRTKPFIS